MQIYIPQFWCGVIATVLFEISVPILYVIFSGMRNRRKGGKK